MRKCFKGWERLEAALGYREGGPTWEGTPPRPGFTTVGGGQAA